MSKTEALQFSFCVCVYGEYVLGNLYKKGSHMTNIISLAMFGCVYVYDMHDFCTLNIVIL